MYQRIIRDPGGPEPVRLLTDTMIVNGSLLLVPADTVAFFVCNGHVSEPYPPGRWEIHTGVGPFFVRFRNIMTHGDPGITCQVWFINNRHENCKSGGTGELIFQEQRFHISLKAKASYVVRYVISEPLLFLSKLVGMHRNSFEEEDIQPAIDAMLLPHIKHAVITYISTHSIHSIQTDLAVIGDEICILLRNELRGYGLSIRSAAVTAVNIPDSEFGRLAALEEKYANGTINTTIELDNVNRIYGNVENRTLTEMMTGTLRGPGTAVQRETAGAAGMLASLPVQISIADQMMRRMSGPLGSLMETVSDGGHGTQDLSMETDHPAPDLPVRRRICPNCHRELDNADAFCRYCGHRL